MKFFIEQICYLYEKPKSHAKNTSEIKFKNLACFSKHYNIHVHANVLIEMFHWYICHIVNFEFTGWV